MKHLVIYGLIFFVSAILLLQVTALEVRSTFTNDNLKDNNATFNCNWTRANGENPLFLIITKNDTTFQCFLNTSPASCSSSFPQRYTYTLNPQGSILFNITDLQCSDVGVYSCKIILASGTSAMNESFLNIKAPPGPPTLSNLHLEVQENSNITATCAANLGYPRPLKIEWKTYRNGQFVDYSSDLVITAINVSKQGDDMCAANVQSTVYLKADKKHQNMELVCFVTNEDFQPAPPPLCTNPMLDLCNQTSTVNVTYGVTEIQLSMNPITVLEGQTVTFSCYSDGNPTPTYTWTKENDNRTLNSVMDGSVSTLTLRNLRLSEDFGNYTCTASNVVKGITYSKSASRKFVVVWTPNVQNSQIQVKENFKLLAILSLTILSFLF